MVDPHLIIEPDELQLDRTAKELEDWLNSKFEEFGKSDAGKSYIRGRKGLAKILTEEVYALSILLNYKFPGRNDIKAHVVIGDQPFDAVITDYSTTTPDIQLVEIVQAIDGYEDSLRMEVLDAEGSVSVTGPVTASGTKRQGRKIVVKSEAKAGADSRNETFSLITSAALKKLEKSYNPDTWLVIAFEDNLGFQDPEHLMELRRFLETTIFTLDWQIARLFVLGRTRGAAFEFDILNKAVM